MGIRNFFEACCPTVTGLRCSVQAQGRDSKDDQFVRRLAGFQYMALYVVIPRSLQSHNTGIDHRLSHPFSSTHFHRKEAESGCDGSGQPFHGRVRIIRAYARSCSRKMRRWKKLGGAWEEEMSSRERAGSGKGRRGGVKKDLPQVPFARWGVGLCHRGYIILTQEWALWTHVAINHILAFLRKRKVRKSRLVLTMRLCLSIQAENHRACSKCSMGGGDDSLEGIWKRGTAVDDPD